MSEELQKKPKDNLTVGNKDVFQTEVLLSPYESSDLEWLKEKLWDIYRFRKQALLFFLVCLFVVFLFTFSQKPIYRGESVVKINSTKSEVVPYKQVSNDEPGLFDWETFFKTQCEIIKSRSLAQRVVERLELDEHLDWLGLKPKKNGPLPSSEKLSEIVQNNLHILPVRGTRLIRICYDSPNSFGAMQVANAYAESFITFGLDRKLEANRHARQFLAGQIELMKKKVTESEAKLARFMEKTGIVKLPGVNSSPTEKELAQVSDALAKARFEMIRKEVFYERAKNGLDMGKSLTIPDNQYTMDIKKNLLKEQAKYRELEEIYKEDYPKMVRLKAGIDGLNQQLAEEKQAVVEKLEAEYEAAKKNFESLEEEWKKTLLKLKDENSLLAKYAMLKREADANQQMYMGLLKRLKETDITSALNSGNIEVVETASIPKKPVKPKKMLNLLLGLFGGSVGGIGLALGLALLDNRFRGKDDIEKFLKIPVLGVIPDIEKLKKHQPETYEGDIPYALMTYALPESEVSNGFRSIRTLLHYTIAGRRPQVITVTSTLESEGKSGTTVNLATVLGQQGTVLVIDADLRRPSIHKILGLRPRPGLSEILTGQAQVEEAVQPTSLPNVWAIVGGRAALHPADLLGAESFSQLCRSLREYFTYILIDTPPMRGMPDAPIVSMQSEGVLYVIEDGRDDRKEVQNNIEAFSRINSRVLGIILNRADPLSHSSYYYAYKYRSQASSNSQELMRKEEEA
ncbi:GumC family protein [Candidatus Methylacidiphilum infernorum]|uniref:Capsular polysaccharide synthesis enzyme cpsD fused to Mrp family ATPase n=1 Tax=Methylacidiphilum infernorum (isolate V4) TaxID=481448 RepID=B3DZK9_METI4|nr:polysaccharide biosynthesis tyrosine autokinase [Candidatus Methylacidiphilum infernorum]ACD82626.1 Capsular polysaccharide synthesis enzyme cpsD fused to Mrp family ATPase [Methylacidiphilum infernorum V4]